MLHFVVLLSVALAPDCDDGEPMAGQLPGCFCRKGSAVGQAVFGLPKDEDLDANEVLGQIVFLYVCVFGGMLFLRDYVSY